MVSDRYYDKQVIDICAVHVSNMVNICIGATGHSHSTIYHTVIQGRQIIKCVTLYKACELRRNVSKRDDIILGSALLGELPVFSAWERCSTDLYTSLVSCYAVIYGHESRGRLTRFLSSRYWRPFRASQQTSYLFHVLSFMPKEYTINSVVIYGIVLFGANYIVTIPLALVFELPAIKLQQITFDNSLMGHSLWDYISGPQCFSDESHYIMASIPVLMCWHSVSDLGLNLLSQLLLYFRINPLECQLRGIGSGEEHI
ncbi:unnamed protein product [Medioppia subpectinata]|uniref:Uncharacterized protein n=1 Tax=Medioppia subpectinata TaxID=1979941 RepID=A0A7R9KHT0_9ACAR|nr:unnamed protein product [Medioppia subpectinata]CAG2103732.1 unnamed protein product [Medioppia subpectinata]